MDTSLLNEEDMKVVVQNKVKGKYNPQKWGAFLEGTQKRADFNEQERYRKAFLHSMQAYERENRVALNTYLSYYKEAISPDFFETHYVLLQEEKLRGLLSRCKIMVLTANPIEKAVFHFMMVQKSHRKIIRILSGNTIYFVLKWGKYWVAHIHQNETGSYKNMGSGATIDEALKQFTPNVIISLGVAFGIDHTAQNIGDVIVSRRILPYSENKRDESKIKPDRSQDKTIDDWLHVRLVNVNGFLEGVTYGDILSGGSVISSFAEKDAICSGYTKADFIIGGEMEGNALFQRAKSTGIPGVVIKGICDWGVAKNDIFPDDLEKEESFKDSLQAFAMAQAIEKSTPLFNDKEIFAVPKDVKSRELTRKYKFARNSLVLSQLLIILHGILSLYARISRSALALLRIIESPFIWICFPLALCAILAAQKWREKRRTLKFDSETTEMLEDIRIPS